MVHEIYVLFQILCCKLDVRESDNIHIIMLYIRVSGRVIRTSSKVAS